MIATMPRRQLLAHLAVVCLAVAPATTLHAADTAAPAPAATATLPTPAGERPQGAAWLRIASVAAVTAGTAMLGSGAVLGYRTWRHHRGAENGAENSTENDADITTRHAHGFAGRETQRLANWHFGLGAAAVALGLGAWGWSHLRASPDAPQRPAALIMLTPSAGGAEGRAQILLSGRF